MVVGAILRHALTAPIHSLSIMKQFKIWFRNLSSSQALVFYTGLLMNIAIIAIHNPTKGYDPGYKTLEAATREAIPHAYRAGSYQKWSSYREPPGKFVYSAPNPFSRLDSFISVSTLPGFEILRPLESVLKFITSVVVIMTLLLWLMGIRKSSEKK